MRVRNLLASLAFPLIAACGGGDSNDTAIQQVQTSATLKQVLAGDWPISGAYGYFSVQDQYVWPAIWSHRLANIDCSQRFNAPACSQTAAPEIDFSQYTLIGIYRGRIGHFIGLPQSLAVTQVDGAVFVDYAATKQSTLAAPPDSTPGLVFFLVRQRGTPFNPITFRFSSGA